MASSENLQSIQQLMETSGVRFGTSGARGLVSDMTDAVCQAYTLGFLQVIGAKPGGRVALGMDLRPSSPRIVKACCAAIRQQGLEAEFCGALPTPALAYYAQEQGIPAIMVTGSHIPFDRNGIKFYRPDGEITKADETAISQAWVNLPAHLDDSPLQEVNGAASRAYADRYLRFFPDQVLTGMRLGFYEHSSVARDLFGDILHALGARVISLGRTENFVPIDTEAVCDADAQQARHWAAEHDFDAILSTDGDADRPLLGDEHGNWLRGDIVGILCAQYLGAQAVATPVSSNTALEKCGSFDQVRRTRIGSPYVIEAMEQMLAQGAANVVGYEANGGFLVGSRLEKSGRVLQPLPTRDAVLPVLALLAQARERGLPLSALPQGLPRRYTASDRLQSFPTENSRALLRELAGTNAAIGALTADLCGAPVEMDVTDGLRITHANGEIIHLRPSGNAPELRCYAEADSEARAGQLVRECLARIHTRYA
jgi:phosphomannomutase